MGTSEGGKPLSRRTRFRWNDNIRIDVKEIRRDLVDQTGAVANNIH